MSENRWNKISRKFTNSPSATSDAVKKFLELNFTSGYHGQLCGTSSSSPEINPALIMDLRHNSVN